MYVYIYIHIRKAYCKMWMYVSPVMAQTVHTCKGLCSTCKVFMYQTLGFIQRNKRDWIRVLSPGLVMLLLFSLSVVTFTERVITSIPFACINGFLASMATWLLIKSILLSISFHLPPSGHFGLMTSLTDENILAFISNLWLIEDNAWNASCNACGHLQCITNHIYTCVQLYRCANISLYNFSLVTGTSNRSTCRHTHECLHG